MAKLYRAGIYTRLSTDDANNSAKAKSYIPSHESASIENQKLLLSKFVMLNGWIETKVYADDGYGGGNFNRPGFLEMLEDARNGVINLILVKDLSRLGRDYIEVGRYTDAVFPSLGCRFVSLLDGIDTASDENDMLHFRSLMNDYHLKDLSNKIKAVRYSKVKNGQFLGAYAPYGYRKSPADKHQLIVDEYSAGIVKRIYGLRLQKIGYGKIAGILNNDGILSPRGYWHSQYGKGKCKYSMLWMYATVKDILNNELYLGHLVQNHTGTLSYKDKTQIEKPRDEWVRHENAHESIVSPEVWNQVQEINRQAKEAHSHARKPVLSLFAGKLFCMDCGSPLNSGVTVRRNKNGEEKRHFRYSCSRHVQSGGSVCSRHTISELALKEILLQEIQAHAREIALDKAAVFAKLKHRMTLDDSGHQDLMRQELQHLEQRLKELERITADLYEDKVAGKISASAFAILMEKNEQECQHKKARRDELRTELTAIQEKILSISKWAEVVGKHIHLTELDRAAIDELIDRVEIGESVHVDGKRQQEVKVYYRFIGFAG